MKFIAIRSNIKDALSVVEKGTGENTNLPILKNLLIEANEGAITFTTTNLETAIGYKITGKVIENGKVTIPVALLSSLITNLQSDRLNFEKKGNDLEVATDNYSAIIKGLPAEDFPITPKIKNSAGYVEIKGAFLKEAIQQATVAAQFSDLRPELNSVLFNFSIDDMKFVATDGFRLAERTVAGNMVSSKNEEPFKILVPLKTAYELARIVREEDVVRMTKDENQAFWKTERAELISRLVEGGFPDYSAIIPQKFAAEIVVDREELAGAIKLAGVFGQKNGEITLKIHQNKKAIEVMSADQALGENKHILPAKIKGDANEVFFNWRYLADPIKMIKSEEVFIGLQEEANPAIIKPTTDSSYFYILKPILKA